MKTTYQRRYLTLLIAALSLASLPAESQTPAAPAASVALTGIAHVAIRTSNLASTRAFFEKLGFVQAFELTKDGAPTEEFIKINDHQFLELYPQAKPEDPLGYLHLCFESNNLDSLNAAYITRGLTPTPVKKAGAGNLLFVLRGPDQQVIEFTQYLPGSMHTLDQGKHLGENRISTSLASVVLSLNDSRPIPTYLEQKLGFAAEGVHRGAEVLALPGDSGQTIAVMPRSTGPSFALVFAIDDQQKTAERLHAAGFTANQQGDLLLLDGPEGSLVVFTSSRKP